MTRPEIRRYAIDDQGMVHSAQMTTFSTLLTGCGIIGVWDDRKPTAARPAFSWNGFDVETNIDCMACVARSRP